MRAIIISNIIVLAVSGFFIMDRLEELKARHGDIYTEVERLEAWKQELESELERVKMESEVHISYLRQVEPTEGVIPLTLDNITLMARIIEAEAKGEGADGKVAVGNVILNRIKDENFPDTLEAVIYQPKQFQPVSNGAINNTPSKKTVEVAIEVLQGKRILPDHILYFYNPALTNDTWIRTRTEYTRIGNHVFSY